MMSHMEGQQLEQLLPHILTPVYCIIEEDTICNTTMGTSAIASLTFF